MGATGSAVVVVGPTVDEDEEDGLVILSREVDDNELVVVGL